MIYADYNATTPLCPTSTEWMKEVFSSWGNPSSAHSLGREAFQLLERYRTTVAQAFKVTPMEVVFTSGGSEANTMALLGSFWNTEAKPFHLITSKMEHSSVNDTVGCLQKLGAKIDFVRSLPSGIPDVTHLEELLSSNSPHLVSLMAANNETGAIYPIEAIGRLCQKAGVKWHCDAVQAFGKLDPQLLTGADYISISAHKIHGPKGAGALIVRKGNKLWPTHFGGSQELKRRGGTHNMIGIAGFAGACQELPPLEKFAELEALRNRFETFIASRIDGFSIQAAESPRLSNTTNLRIQGISSALMLTSLDLAGICLSAGSACSSGSINPSHVLLEMGLSPEAAKECLRISWGKLTTSQEIDQAAQIVVDHVNRIRSRRNGN